MKTLYRILGIDVSATTEQIEAAYAKFSGLLQDSANGLSSEEIGNQTIAVREAYRTLSNPILRQRYDQKLAAAEFSQVHVQDAFAPGASSGSFFSLKTIGLIGLIVLAGLYFYNQSAKEREKLRIDHEHEVQLKAIKIAEDQQKQAAKVQDTILDRTAPGSSSNASAQSLAMQQQQFERESAQRQQIEMQRQRQEQQLQQQQQREEENRQRQEQQRHQQRLQSEKRLLQQMERDNYGKVITY